MNGALTIGTLDGANVEIREQVGSENFFLFGLTVEQVIQLKAGGYNPRQYYEMNLVLRETIDQIASGVFSPGNRDLVVEFGLLYCKRIDAPATPEHKATLEKLSPEAVRENRASDRLRRSLLGRI